jgi:hypothetical protein
MYYSKNENVVLTFYELFKTKNTKLINFLFPIYDMDFSVKVLVEMFEGFSIEGDIDSEYSVVYKTKRMDKKILFRDDVDYSYNNGEAYLPIPTHIHEFISDYHIYNDELMFNPSYLRKLKIDNLNLETENE